MSTPLCDVPDADVEHDRRADGERHADRDAEHRLHQLEPDAGAHALPRARRRSAACSRVLLAERLDDAQARQHLLDDRERVALEVLRLAPARSGVAAARPR